LAAAAGVACLALAACSSGSASTDAQPVAAGTVTVKNGHKVVCVMRIADGKGRCTVPAASVGVGTNTIVGQYTGKGYSTGQSRPVYLTVTKTPTSTTIAVSPPTIAYGQEQGERVTVKVIPPLAGTPTGIVKVLAGTVTVCAIKLSAGTGSCAIPSRSLPVGVHPLFAYYPGDTSFNGSSSGRQALTISH